MESPTREIGLKRQLLLDDWILDDVWMLRRAPETPAKHLANPILPHSGGTVIYDAEDKVFKMWYGIPIPGTFEARGAYAVSSDGIRWEKPELGLVEYDGSRKNNLIATNGFGSVLKDPHDPDPARRYKMMTKRKATAVSEGRAFAAFSPDGVHWQDHPGEKSIVRASSDGNGCVIYDESIGRYVNFRRPTVRAAGRSGDWAAVLGCPDTRARKPASARMPWAGASDAKTRDLEEVSADPDNPWANCGFPDDGDFLHRHEAEDFIHRYLRAAPYVHTRALRLYMEGKSDKPCNRRVARAESEDFLHWTDPEVIIRPDELDPPKLYSMSVFQYQSMYVGFLQVYHSWGHRSWGVGTGEEPETMETQLAFSRDGWRWERLANRPVFIPRGLIGSFDGGMISNVQMVEHGDDLLFYYTGSDSSHNIVGKMRGLGVARLPKERLVARAAGDEPGIALTKPFRLEGRCLAVNADASRGALRVEIADPCGAPLEGFDVASCRGIRSDGLRLPVEWGGGKSLEALAGRTVRLRFFLCNARLYSFTFG